MNILKKIALASAVLAMTGCASQEQVGNDVKEMMVGPEEAPVKTITNFSDGLRCMDSEMIRHGVQDIAILVEDLEDRTSKVNAGTKDMLISAVSSMTRRSRAIKLIAFGNDSGNLISFHAQAGSLAPYANLPQYDIRGSISQLDSNVARRQEDAGVSADDFGVGPSWSTSGSVLGLDLSVLDTQDMAVLPGVVSSNSVIIYKSGAGIFAEATIKKTGLFYSFSINKNEGTAQALRNLIELATIELVGRLVKVPYWQCIGIEDDSLEVRREIEDWYYAMQAHDELIPYVTRQLRNRGHYLGEAGSGELRASIESYQRSKGVPVTGAADLELFDLILTGRVPAIYALEAAGNSAGETSTSAAGEELTTQAVSSQAEVAPEPPAAPMPSMSLTAAGDKRSFGPGELVQLDIELRNGGYLYCYFEDEQGDIQRFFPNRFEQNNYIEAGTRLRMPGQLPFDMVAASSGSDETVACYASRENLYHQLPTSVKAYDFENLDVASLIELDEAFDRAGNTPVERTRFVIETN